MKILVTGAKGFVGKNLCAELKNRGFADVFEYDLDTDPALLEDYARQCELVFHLAGVNRPENPNAFMEGNFGFTSVLLDALERHGNRAGVVLSSSVQALLENPYGQSKRAGEQLLLDYGNRTGARVLVYRFPNLFGKWCRPNYNSVVATFCHQVARGLPIQVNAPEAEICFAYIDDVVEELIAVLRAQEHHEGEGPFCAVPVTYTVTLGRVADLIRSFAQSRETLCVADLSDAFTRKLYATYLSYLPEDRFGYSLKMNRDGRGSFTEFLRTPDRGQVSINVAKPGITKGQHWHHTKNEKFLVVSGKGLIRFRKIGSPQVIEYAVSGEELKVIDIPTGYTHNIINAGDTDMVTVMWASEPFDPEHPDTYFEQVEPSCGGNSDE